MWCSYPFLWGLAFSRGGERICSMCAEGGTPCFQSSSQRRVSLVVHTNPQVYSRCLFLTALTEYEIRHSAVRRDAPITSPYSVAALFCFARTSALRFDACNPICSTCTDSHFQSMALIHVLSMVLLPITGLFSRRLQGR